MRNNPFRSGNVAERCDSLDGRVTYANKQIKNPDETTQGRLLVAGVLGAVSRVLKCHANDIGTVFTPSVESGRAAQERSQSALDICEELLNVGDAQISAALTSLPTFTLPSRRSGGGVAMSFGGDEDEQLPAALETVAREAEVLKAFVQQTTPFTAGTRVAAFVDALLASDISESSKVEGAVSDAFSVAEKIPAPARDDDDDDRFDGGAISL